MNKSEIVRAAGAASKKHQDSETVCYCTPSRAMRLSIKNVCLNQNLPNTDEVIHEIEDRVAVEMRKVTGTEDRGYTLRDFDTMDSSAAYTLGWEHDRVTRSFEQAAKVYEKEEIAAWDAAKAEWETAVGAWVAAEAEWKAAMRTAAPIQVRHKAAAPLDPAEQRAKAKTQKSTVTQAVK